MLKWRIIKTRSREKSTKHHVQMSGKNRDSQPKLYVGKWQCPLNDWPWPPSRFHPSSWSRNCTLIWDEALSFYCRIHDMIYQFDLRVNSYLLDDPFAALISSSARHSAMVLIFLNALSRAPVVKRYIAWFTRRRGEISTAWRLTTPADPILVASSLGPLHKMLNNIQHSYMFCNS